MTQLKTDGPTGQAELYKNLRVWGDVGLFGASPVAQHAAITDPSGGGTVDAESRTAINTILDALQQLGIIAT